MTPKPKEIVQHSTFPQNFINNLIKIPTVGSSSLGIKYPTYRDHPLNTGSLWLDGKRTDDGAENLWRIHDNLYDLQEFIENHPGGREWLELTKGTDITEAFESHHLTSHPEEMLPKFFVKKASSVRKYPFTFAEDGFYKTLKGRIVTKLATIPKGNADRSKLLTDLLMSVYVIFALTAVYFHSFFIGALSGVALSLTAIASHNFFHQKDNIRMYYFNFTMMQYRDWRISHALSHHMYTNTIDDLEISTVEPFLNYLPTQKHFIFRYISWIYSPIVYAFMFFGHFIKTLCQSFILKKPINLGLFLPFTIPILMYLITRQSLIFCVIMFLWIEITGGIHFGFVGVNAAHHHPDIFHDGDAPRANLDWGIFQMDAVMDRKDITGSHFLVLTNFGDHALHHLFPTIDHGLLQYLYPVFLETCDEFGIDWRLSSMVDLVKGQYRQLAKIEPNRIAPGTIRWKRNC